jgi:folate-binding Fe-S cluster repair protein YgfZ
MKKSNFFELQKYVFFSNFQIYNKKTELVKVLLQLMEVSTSYHSKKYDITKITLFFLISKTKKNNNNKYIKKKRIFVIIVLSFVSFI